MMCCGGQVVKEQKIPRTMGWKCLYFHIFLLMIQVQRTHSLLDC